MTWFNSNQWYKNENSLNFLVPYTQFRRLQKTHFLRLILFLLVLLLFKEIQRLWICCTPKVDVITYKIIKKKKKLYNRHRMEISLKRKGEVFWTETYNKNYKKFTVLYSSYLFIFCIFWGWYFLWLDEGKNFLTAVTSSRTTKKKTSKGIFLFIVPSIVFNKNKKQKTKII